MCLQDSPEFCNVAELVPEIESPASRKTSRAYGAGTSDAVTDEAKFNPDFALPASVYSGNSSNQGNNPSSNRISGNCLPGFHRVPHKTVHALGWGLKLDSQLSCTRIPEADTECKFQMKGRSELLTHYGGHSKSRNLVPSCNGCQW